MKVGDYVRTNQGIAKYLGLGRDVLKHETNKNTYLHYYSQHLFDNYIFDVGHDYGDTLTNDEFNNIDKLGKVKESIIDLIEVGDFVNGDIVIKSIPKDKRKKQIIIIDSTSVEYGEVELKNEDIKTILTKEQYDFMKYKV